MQKYDVVIIGAGLSGLVSGATLSKEGLKVCVLEKNPVIGGCLQSFKRKGHILDTGVHYVGSMDEGKFLNQYFKYCGILDKLNLRRLDDDVYEEIYAGDRKYEYGMGYDRFRDGLIHVFPGERNAIDKYCQVMKEVGELIHIDHLKKGQIYSFGIEYMGISGSAFIDSLTTNQDLRNALSGTISLYGGERNVTSLYQHAMINYSNLEGAYRFVDGSQQLADFLAEVIKDNGGEVLTRKEVTRLRLTGNRITTVEVNEEECFEGKYVISNLHPQKTFDLTEKTGVIKKAFLSRVNNMKNSYGMFTAYLILKQDRIRYQNRNSFLYRSADPWNSIQTTCDGKASSLFLSMQPSESSPEFAQVVSILSPMFVDDVMEWSDTTVGKRGDAYERFKEIKARELIAMSERIIPGLSREIDAIYTASPLTYRDYTGTPDGSAYGIVKNCKNPITTLFPVRTKIENLLLTGQNMNMHGLVGCSVTSALTCSEILGMDYLARKIGNV